MMIMGIDVVVGEGNGEQGKDQEKSHGKHGKGEIGIGANGEPKANSCVPLFAGITGKGVLKIVGGI